LRAVCARVGTARIAWNWIHPSRRPFAARGRQTVTVRKKRPGEARSLRKPMPPKRKFPKPKWKRGLCQQRGCRVRVKGRAPLCEKHLAGRKDEPKVGGNEADA
jgi:hypothetical protein